MSDNATPAYGLEVASHISA